MGLDFTFLLALIPAVFKGFSKGLVVSALSFVAYYIGLAAALKLSAVVAGYLSHDKDPSPWLPLYSFVLVFIGVVLIINFASRALRTIIRIGQLGIFDRLGGVAFYILIYLFIFSILIFYGEKLGFISYEMKKSSIACRYIGPIAPAMVGFLGKMIPVFGDLFSQLKDYFGSLKN
ncbi:MAG: CvpA family protein [Chitinophagaceae bacterium]|nr:CvpA family protein [Chitinophagaceae bacterium]